MFKGIKPVIGMLHAPALPGSPAFLGNLKDLHEFVLKDAESLVAGGVDALMLENYGDLPFFPGAVPDSTVANLTALARKVRAKFRLPLGINVLRNDGVSALAIAQAVGAQFVRVNILSGARLTDQGIINGNAHEVLRFRKKIGASSIQIFADISVKCSVPLAERPLKNEVEETIQRSGAEGLIVSGENTGKPVDIDQLKEVKKLSKDFPVWIGSGANIENILQLNRWADGFIVGSAFKKEIHDPIDPKRVHALVEKLKKGKKK